MTQTSLAKTLLLAGLVAAGGLVQAQTFDTPQQAGEMSTMTNGQPNRLTTNSPYADGTVVIDTRVLGAPPSTTIIEGPTSTTVVTTTTYSSPVVTYAVPMLPHHYQGHVLSAPVLQNPDTVVTPAY